MTEGGGSGGRSSRARSARSARSGQARSARSARSGQAPRGISGQAPRAISVTEKKIYRKDDEKDAPDAKGATEDQNIKSNTIKGSETLGYKGEAREEHSGQNAPRRVPGLKGDLANQNPKKR